MSAWFCKIRRRRVIMLAMVCLVRIVLSLAQAQARVLAVQTLNEAAAELLSSGGVTYDSLMHVTADGSGQVRLIHCADPYEEAEAAAALIESAVRGGARYRDFVVICRDAVQYEGILDAALEKVGIPVAYFDVQHFEDYLRMLEICTQLTGQPQRYETYGTVVSEEISAAMARQDGSAPTILGSENNLLGEMLRDLGCVNIADGSGLLEDLSMEAIIAADPDYIFAVLQGADAARARTSLDAALLQNPAWSSLRAVQEGRFYTLDHALYNLKPNARWGEAYERLADILYP